jgi:hypothetical protein
MQVTLVRGQDGDADAVLANNRTPRANETRRSKLIERDGLRVGPAPPMGCDFRPERNREMERGQPGRAEFACLSQIYLPEIRIA